jgi:hypothetical protein
MMRASTPQPPVDASAGLSQRTQQLWLASQRYRRFADGLTAADRPKASL